MSYLASLERTIIRFCSRLCRDKSKRISTALSAPQGGTSPDSGEVFFKGVCRLQSVSGDISVMVTCSVKISKSSMWRNGGSGGKFSAISAMLSN